MCSDESLSQIARLGLKAIGAFSRLSRLTRFTPGILLLSSHVLANSLDFSGKALALGKEVALSISSGLGLLPLGALLTLEPRQLQGEGLHLCIKVPVHLQHGLQLHPVLLLPADTLAPSARRRTINVETSKW